MNTSVNISTRDKPPAKIIHVSRPDDVYLAKKQLCTVFLIKSGLQPSRIRLGNEKRMENKLSAIPMMPVPMSRLGQVSYV